MATNDPAKTPDLAGLEQTYQLLRDERFRVLVQGVKDYAIFMIDLDGRIVCWNHGAALIFGYSEAEVLGQHYSLFFSPADTERGEPAREINAAKAKGSFECECQRVRKDGTTFTANVVIGPIYRDGTSELLGYSQITRDVTEHKRLEEQLRHSQKMEAIGTLSAGVAHDFNNLLTVINGYAAVLLGTTHEHDPMRGPIIEIGKAGDRAALLTKQLLAFSRKQVLVPQILNLNTQLNDTLSILRRLLGPNVDVVLALTPELWSVEVDPGQLEQVFLNLVVNARDAMPNGGRLTLQTSNVEFCSSTAPDGVKVGRYVLFAVTDTGIGMDAKTLARIFDPFFSTKGVGKGTGLGLSTVYGVAKQSGGHVDAESQRGVGTILRVYLPSVNQAPLPAKADALFADTPNGTEALLFVEDEAGILSLGMYLLDRSGYTVLTAANGAEAVEIGTHYSGVIDLLVIDVVMPGISGLQAATRLKVLRPAMKVLYMSGFAHEAVANQGLLLPGTPFLQKPFTLKALTMKVRETIDGQG